MEATAARMGARAVQLTGAMAAQSTAACHPRPSKKENPEQLSVRWAEAGRVCTLRTHEGSEGSGAPESWADEANAFECVGCCICKVDGGDDRGDAVENGSVVIGPILASHGSTESGAAVPSSNTLSSSNYNDVGQAVKGGKLSQALSAAKAKMEAACIGDDEQNPLPPAPPLPPLESDLTGYIGMLSTAPSMQGLGIAKRMLSLSLTSLINNYKCGSVILEVEEGNSAMHVYRSMGFVEVGRWSNYYLNGGGARRFRLEVG